jgi:high-affinity iron transporter
LALLPALLVGATVQAADAAKPTDIPAITAQLLTHGDAAIAAYDPRQGMNTEDAFSTLYFEVFEGSGMEMAIALRDPQRKSELESLFGGVIGKAVRGEPVANLRAAWQSLRDGLEQAGRDFGPSVDAGQQGGQGMSFWSVALQAFLILVREGFEAMLVITALVAYLRRQDASHQLPVIYYGVGLALLASVLTAWLLQAIFHINGGASQEALEGVTMLIAAAVLFYVSYWLIAKSEASRWQAWIRGQIHQALSKGSLFTLGFAAFLAVYREGAETVLFYQALAGQVDGQWMALTMGMVAAALTLVAMYWVMRKASLHLPIGLFFAITAGLLYYLAISFAGNGVLELQEAGWVAITPVDWLPRITWLGVYPTLETSLAQLLLLAPLPFALWWWMKQRRDTASGEEVSG